MPRKVANGRVAPMIAGNPSEPALPREITERARQLGPLESPVIWWVLAGLAIALLAVAVWRWRSRRVRWWGLATSVVCVLLAAATAVNSYVGYVRTVDDLGRLMRLGSGPVAAMGHLLDNGQSQPDSTSSNSPSDSGSRGPVPHGHDISRSVSARIENLDIADPANAVPSGGNLVLLPPGYFDPANAERRYPVVYLFHGYPYGGPNDWLTSGDAPGNLKALETAKLISPMIVVSVDMTAGQPSRDW